MVTIILELDQETEQAAREFGLLSTEKLTQMIENEIREQKRDRAIQKLREIMQQLHALEPKLTQEEIDEELRKPTQKP